MIKPICIARTRLLPVPWNPPSCHLQIIVLTFLAKVNVILTSYLRFSLHFYKFYIMELYWMYLWLWLLLLNNIFVTFIHIILCSSSLHMFHCCIVIYYVNMPWIFYPFQCINVYGPLSSFKILIISVLPLYPSCRCLWSFGKHTYAFPVTYLGVNYCIRE